MRIAIRSVPYLAMVSASGAAATGPVFDPSACAVNDFIGVFGVIAGGGDTFDCYTAMSFNTASDLPNGGTAFSAAWIAGILSSARGDTFDTYADGSDLNGQTGGKGFGAPWIDPGTGVSGDDFDSYAAQNPITSTLSGGLGFSAAWIKG